MLSLLYSSQTLTWFANVKVHSAPHVEYFLDNDFGQGSRTEQDRSFPLCPLQVDGTVGDQVQPLAQVAVWLSSIYSEPSFYQLFFKWQYTSFSTFSPNDISTSQSLLISALSLQLLTCHFRRPLTARAPFALPPQLLIQLVSSVTTCQCTFLFRYFELFFMFFRPVLPPTTTTTSYPFVLTSYFEHLKALSGYAWVDDPHALIAVHPLVLVIHPADKLQI